MNSFYKYIFYLGFLFCFSYSAMAAEVIGERIIFLKEDGRSYLNYSTTRSDYPSYGLYYEKMKYSTLDDALKQYMYFYPNDYIWDDSSRPDHNLIWIQQGSYAALRQEKFGNELKVGEDGLHTYSNWDGITKNANGHFGSWNSPDNFTQFVYVWVIPQKFEIVNFECNKEGEWVQRQNTIAYYGKNVNDLVFTIKYRPRNMATFDVLKNTLGGQQKIQLLQENEGVRITLEATVLFPSGKAELTSDGKAILKKVANALMKSNKTKIVVQGYTDNVPIKGELAKIYISNWELSAARSLSVLHYLAENGITESRLEARAYGAQRPIVSNSTEEGRSKNRRIELMVIE